MASHVLANENRNKKKSIMVMIIAWTLVRMVCFTPWQLFTLISKVVFRLLFGILNNKFIETAFWAKVHLTRFRVDWAAVRLTFRGDGAGVTLHDSGPKERRTACAYHSNYILSYEPSKRTVQTNWDMACIKWKNKIYFFSYFNERRKMAHNLDLQMRVYGPHLFQLVLSNTYIVLWY
jgi:hypothetical protein